MIDVSSNYLLSQHAHICVLQECIVVLDLASGKYLSLDAVQASSASHFVKGWPHFEGASEHRDTLEDRDILQVLLNRRLLTRDPALGKPACPVKITTPSAWLGEFRPRGRPHIKVRQVWRFARAALTAAVSLRVMKLQHIVERVARRRAANRGHARASLSELTELLWVFDWLRPLAFHKRDTCLLYSLTLLEFLAYHGVFPDWIFGVSVRPFKAHCWLQQDEHLITDIPVNIGVLTPIMVV